MMKKTILCGLALVAGLVSCTEDYNDWSSPQSNAGGEVNPKMEMTLQPTSSAIDFASETSENIQLFTTNLQEGQAKDYSLLITGEGVDASETLKADEKGYVASANLISAVKNLYGAAPVERTLHITVSTEVKVVTLDGPISVKRQASPFDLKVTLNAPYIDANGYYVVGNIDGWTKTRVDAYHMTNGGGNVYDDPVFSVEIDAVDGISTYEVKAIPAADFKEDGSVNDWGRAFSAPSGVDTPAYEGILANDNSGGNIKFNAIDGAVKYLITINAMTATYTVAGLSPGVIFDTDPVLYLTGNHYNWGSSAEDWIPMVPVYGNPNLSWTIIYLHESEEIKFAPQQGWGSDFGYNAETVNDLADAGASDNNTNLKVSKAGWYLLKVDKTSGARVVTIDKPNIYLIGNTSAAGWEVKESGLFTIPEAEDGKFVSPAFVADDEVRMCIKFADDVDWWKTEFVVTEKGQIDYRGAGGDQARVKVKTGQKCYLNFTNGSGSYK